MNDSRVSEIASAQASILPTNRGAYYGGAWHEPKAGRYADTINPGTGQSLGKVADCGADDVDAAVAAAKTAFKEWRHVPPLERAKMLRRIAEVLRAKRQRTRHDRRRRLRQSGQGDGAAMPCRGGADRVFRRLRHRNEGRVDPDGTGRREFLGPRAAWASSGASSRSITRSCSAPESPQRPSPPAIPSSSNRRNSRHCRRCAWPN